MAIEGGAEQVRRYKRREFTDTDRRASRPESAWVRALTAAKEVVIGKSKKEQQRDELRRELRSALTRHAHIAVEKHKEQYRFLSTLGHEVFDEKILDRAIRSFERRLKKRGKELSVSELARVTDLLSTVAETVYTDHIPAYRDMFRELDERKAGSEIYLGRDGSFMYYARRAQLWGRGERTGKIEGSPNARRITYLSYTRHLKGEKQGLSVEESREYLKDSGIHDVSDVVFVDTGYVGSIPEYLLREVYSITDPVEVDKRIALISSHRESRAIPRSPDAETPYAIEHAPQMTDTVYGVYRDEEAGKLKPLARPQDADHTRA